MKTLIATCVKGYINEIPKAYRKYAFTQEDNVKIDITVGKSYLVYGIVLTDTENVKTPWWMPAEFYDVDISNYPEHWQKRSFGTVSKDTYIASEIYFDASEDIEDGTSRGIEIFRRMREMQD